MWSWLPSANFIRPRHCAIKDFISQVNESGAGVRASFDAENQRFNIASEKTGEEGDFQLLGDGANGDMALNMMKLTDASGGVKMDGHSGPSP